VSILGEGSFSKVAFDAPPGVGWAQTKLALQIGELRGYSVYHRANGRRASSWCGVRSV